MLNPIFGFNPLQGHLCVPEGRHPQYDVRGGGEEDGGGCRGALQVSMNIWEYCP